MKPTIKTLHKRISEASELFTSSKYILLNRPANEVSLVDLSFTCEGNLFGSLEIEIFCRGFMGSYYFEAIVVNEETAKKYSAKSGRYLAITYTL